MTAAARIHQHAEVPRAPRNRSESISAPVVRLVVGGSADGPTGRTDLGGAPGHDLVEVDPAMRRMMELWVERYARTTLEIVAGERPAAHVAHFTRRSVHQDLTRRALLALRAGATPHVRTPGSTPRPVVRKVHLSFVAPRVVEAAVMVAQGEMHRALACRFEWGRDRWRCTALEFC